MQESYQELIEAAADIAEEASKIALSYFRKNLLIETKDNMTPVTIADKKTEEAIRAELTKAFPGFGILGEEFGEEAIDAELVWTVDPIDGTLSFIRGIPLFGTLLGLLSDGEPVGGVMVLPALGETYTAAEGEGAFCNGLHMHMSSTKSLAASFISVGDIYAFRDAGKLSLLNSLQNEATHCRGYTDCFAHALVIRGGLDAMIDPVVNVWDVAPLAAIIQEAGGCYFDFEGKETIRSSSFVSCTPAVKDELLSLIAKS